MKNNWGDMGSWRAQPHNGCVDATARSTGDRCVSSEKGRQNYWPVSYWASSSIACYAGSILPSLFGLWEDLHWHLPCWAETQGQNWHQFFCLPSSLSQATKHLHQNVIKKGGRQLRIWATPRSPNRRAALPLVLFHVRFRNFLIYSEVGNSQKQRKRLKNITDLILVGC
jgi:hypothetical protein